MKKLNGPFTNIIIIFILVKKNRLKKLNGPKKNIYNTQKYYLFIYFVGWLVFFLANRVKYVMMHNYSAIIAKINHLFMIAR